MQYTSSKIRPNKMHYIESQFYTHAKQNFIGFSNISEEEIASFTKKAEEIALLEEFRFQAFKNNYDKILTILHYDNKYSWEERILLVILTSDPNLQLLRKYQLFKNLELDMNLIISNIKKDLGFFSKNMLRYEMFLLKAIREQNILFPFNKETNSYEQSSIHFSVPDVDNNPPKL